MRAYRAQAGQAGGREGSRRAEAPATFTQRVLALQRAAGNTAVARAIEEERHEHGAACGHETAGQPAVERSSAQPSSVLDAVRSPGRPLDSRIMEKAEQGYGMSFRHVRVHSDPAAQRSATAFGARAYTTGHDIVVGPQGADDETMFHELDHVRQQSMGPVAGTDNGSGVAVSSQEDPFELQASANGRRMARGGMPDLSGPGSGVSAGAATTAGSGGGITVARMVSGNGWRMHRADRGLEFEIVDDHGPIIGRYVRSGSDGREIFDTPQGRIRVYPTDIMGPRATVGGLHPAGRVRPPEDNLQDRDEVLLSEANASGARARLRMDPRAADRIAVTTYEEEPDYADYPQNREALRRQGVPVLNSFDISRPETAGRLSNLGPDPLLNFNMPRVPRGTPGYSTQQLIRDTTRIPERTGRDDMRVSITAPHPSQYARPGTHNSIYGLESGRAVPESARMVSAHSDDEGLEAAGYSHRQSTKDEGASAASRKKKYLFERKRDESRRSNSPEEEAGPSYRSRSQAPGGSKRRGKSKSRSESKSRVSEAPAPAPRRRSSRPPVTTRGRAPVNYAAVEDEDEYFGSQQPESSGPRRRRGSVAPSYLMDSEDEGARPRRGRRESVDVRPPERERSRRRPSRAPAGASSSRHVDLGDDVVYGSGPIDREPPRQRGRSRQPSSSRPFITDSGRSTRIPVSYADEPEWEEDSPHGVNPFLPAPREHRRR
ncbi:DUF4157 domain-containing protein [Streptomyces sp. NPDC060030]|uniref:eCIS core domain-containing protein n=1 Tax=Streptomyces sp. NPDC060030 TaxID=3347042 RepID=UPI003689C099